MHRNIFTLPIFLFFVIGSLQAQTSCSRKLQIVKKRLEKQDVRRGLLHEMEASIDSCLTSDGLSFYVKGLIEFRKKEDSSLKNSYTYFEKAAEYDHTRSKTYLGYFHKNGWGTPIDFEQSLYWINEAANDGDDNAIYTLGYYYMKGLAGLEPNYERATDYFEKSNHKMAKHWLGFCKFFGFGTSSDVADAENILMENNVPNSDELLAFLDSNVEPTLQEFHDISKKQSVSSDELQVESEPILQGIWLEKDWKNEKIVRKLPLNLEVLSSGAERTRFKVLINQKEYFFEANEQGQLLSKDLKFQLPSPFSDSEKSEKLTYHVRDFQLSKDADSGLYNIECSVWIEEYNEDGPPVSIRIFSQEAINERIDSSFRVYPNPFDQILNFSFEIEHKSDISLSLYKLDGTKVQNLEYNIMEHGEHALEFNGGQLRPQNYIAVLTVNGFRFARHVIKR